MKRVKDRAIKAIPWAMLESGGTAVLGLLSLPILARLLSPAEFGLATIVISVTAVLDQLVSAPFTESLVQRRFVSPLHIDTAFSVMAGLGIVAFALCCLLAVPLSWLYGLPELAYLLPIAGVGCLISGINAIAGILLTRKMRMRPLAIRTLCARSASLLATGLLAVFGFGATSIVLGGLAGSVTSFLTLWPCIPRRPLVRISRTHLKELLGFGWVTVLEQGLWSVATRIFFLIVGALHQPRDLGYLTIAFRIYEMIFAFLSNASQRFLLPLFSTLQTSPERLRDAVLRVASLQVSVAAPAFLGLAAVAPTLLPLALGDRWNSSVPALQVLCAVGAVACTVWAIVPYLKSIGRPSISLALSLVAATVSIASAFLTANLPIISAALAWGTRVVVNVPGSLLFLRWAGAIRVRLYLIRVARPFAAALAAALVAVVLDLNLTGLAKILRLIVTLGVTALCYAGLLLAIDRSLALEISTLIKRMVRRR